MKKIKYFREKPCKLCGRVIEERNKSDHKNLCCWCYEPWKDLSREEIEGLIQKEIEESFLKTIDIL